MVTLRSLAAAVAGVALLCPTSLALSLKRNALSYVTLIDDAVIKTPSHRVHSESEFDLTFTIHDGQQHIRLVLEPNQELLPSSLTISYLGADGKIESAKQVARTDHKVFKGQSFVKRPGREGWENTGWARITLLRDGDAPLFHGSFKVDGDGHHIHMASRYRTLGNLEDPALPFPSSEDAGKMVVWRDSDISGSDWTRGELKRDVADNMTTCGNDNLGSFDSTFDLKRRDTKDQGSMNLRTLFGRQKNEDSAGNGPGPFVNVLDSIGSTDGCPSTRKIALLGIAVDCEYWENNETEEEVRQHIIDMVNKASQVYEDTFNISLGIGNITIPTEKNECPGSPSESASWNVACPAADMNERLSRFSDWRGQHSDLNAYWTLLTKCPMDSAVGLAWRGELCSQGSHQNPGDQTGDGSASDGRTVSSTNVVVRLDTEWQIFAHETGHTFGAIHDCNSKGECPVDANNPSCCPLSRQGSSCDAAGKFMMAPATSGDISNFSPCSIGNICSFIKNSNRASCLLDNRDVQTVTGSQCGNGIVESGEDCDCGGEQGCKDNKCCNPKTCKYSDNSVCDPTNEGCCTDKCQFSSSNTVCRESASECDPEEKCPGNAGRCPADLHKDNGESCGDGLQCASGQCTSRDQQCRNISGGRNNNVGDCDRDKGCMITCSGDDLAPGVCRAHQQSFLDGTPCRAGGLCNNGNCEGTSTWKAITEWVENNKTISIPVFSVVGLLILIALISCILSCFRRGRRRAAPKPVATNNWPSYRGNPAQAPPPPMQPYNNQYNGGYANYNNGPPNGAAQYAYSAVPNEQEQWQRSRSVRYA
jgi:hypothetical protein